MRRFFFNFSVYWELFPARGWVLTEALGNGLESTGDDGTEFVDLFDAGGGGGGGAEFAGGSLI